MSVLLNRRHRPPPIRIPRFEERDDDVGTPTPITPPPRTPEAPASTFLGTRTLSRAQQSTSAQCAIGTALSCSTSSRTIRSETLPTTALTLATTTTRPGSPTRTTFVTVIQSIQSPKEKQETPNPTQTVFVTTPAAVVTVTAAPTISAPPGATKTNLPSDAQQQGLNALPTGAKIPIIVLSVVG